MQAAAWHIGTARFLILWLALAIMSPVFCRQAAVPGCQMAGHTCSCHPKPHQPTSCCCHHSTGSGQEAAACRLSCGGGDTSPALPVVGITWVLPNTRIIAGPPAEGLPLVIGRAFFHSGLSVPPGDLPPE